MYVYSSLQGLRNPMGCLLGDEIELDPEAQRPVSLKCVCLIFEKRQKQP